MFRCLMIRELFTDEIIRQIITQTNLYFSQIQHDHILMRRKEIIDVTLVCSHLMS